MSRPVREIYLADGGSCHLILERTTTGVLRVEGTLLSHTPDTTFTAEIRQTTGVPWLIIESQEPAWFDEAFTSYHTLFVLVPERDRPRDWLLTYLQQDVQGPDWHSPLRLKVPDDLEGMLSGPFLHRVDDERIADYFFLATSADYGRPLPKGISATSVPAELLRIAEQLTQAYPTDLHVRVLLLDALLRNGQMERLLGEVERGEEASAKLEDRAVYLMFREARRQVEARRLIAEGKNGVKAVHRVLAEAHPPAEKFRLISALFRYEDAKTTASTLLRPGSFLTVRINALREQVFTKVARIRSEFLLLEGRRAEARALAVGYYRAAQLYQHDYTRGTIQVLIGMALRAVWAGTLQIHAANAVQTPTEAAALWRDLEFLNWYERPAEEIRRIPAGPEPLAGKVTAGQGDFVRDKTASAKFQLVRLTLAARWHQISTGYLPVSTDQLRPMFPKGLPVDAFTSTPLRLAAARTTVTLYSTGPDLRDDQGTFSYDPTNGTVSAGDVLVQVPVEREYPFDPQGTRAASAADLLRQFQNGLPPDPFADTKGRSYSITDGPGQVTLFSFGPDTDEAEVIRSWNGHLQPVVDYTPLVPYDPTNGAVSRGDILLKLPAR